jgi:hypothetical protein
VLYVPGMKKTLISVLAIEDRGFVVTFKRGKLLILLEKYSLDTRVVIRIGEGTLYRLQGKLVQDLVHDNENLCEL